MKIPRLGQQAGINDRTTLEVAGMDDHSTKFFEDQAAMIAAEEHRHSIGRRAHELVAAAWDLLRNEIPSEREALIAFGNLLETWRYTTIGKVPTDRPKRKAIPRSLRQQVMERDAYRCTLCGDWHNLELDHIYPVWRGGEDTAENLRVLCGDCNSLKGGAL
jgi:hypothetical protein